MRLFTTHRFVNSKTLLSGLIVTSVQREQALASIEAMNGKEISPGEVITCTIAKPSDQNQQNRRRRGGKLLIFWELCL